MTKRRNYKRALDELVDAIEKQLNEDSLPAGTLVMDVEMLSAYQKARTTLGRRATR